VADSLLVLTTFPDAAAAERLAGRLVRDGLAACVNIAAPSTSVYLWQGKVETETEIVVQIKTVRARFDAVRDTIVASHPYELPEVIAVTITDGLPDYLAWIESCTTSS
jgi:periplasmic divalent cation tolerance protein